uniref:prostate-associated microseminoprotein n=1 Tax=Euleptes europaea TaxID=460621 RepID=UPI002540DF0F|nr:prostate-associated microseminoprotein [Euleptes europaea]
MTAEGCQVGPRASRRACLLLFLLAPFAGTQPACFFQAQAPCLYKGMHFAPWEAWRDAQCLNCGCLHPFGVGCCDTHDRMSRPLDFPDWCQLHYHFQTCEVSLVQKARPRLPCAQRPEEHEWGSADHPE